MHIFLLIILIVLVYQDYSEVDVFFNSRYLPGGFGAVIVRRNQVFVSLAD